MKLKKKYFNQLKFLDELFIFFVKCHEFIVGLHNFYHIRWFLEIIMNITNC